MKALVKSKAEPGLWLQEVPEPAIGINDLLIRVLRTGICGTDLHIYDWDAWAQRTIHPPLVAGDCLGADTRIGQCRHFDRLLVEPWTFVVGATAPGRRMTV